MRKWFKGPLIGILTLALSLFWTIGCGGVEWPDTTANTLAAVPESSISASLQGTELTVEWGAVENATSYMVTIDDTTRTVDAPNTALVFYNFETATGSVTISIFALAPGYVTSVTTCSVTLGENPPVEAGTLAKPTGLAVSNGKLTWTAVSNATSYTVSDGTKAVTVNTNSVNLANNGLTVPTSGSATYTVIAKADGYTDSAAASYTYTPSVNPPQPQTLATPSGLVVSNGKLTWTAVSNAMSYTVSDGTKTVTVYSNSVNLANNGLTVPTSGSVTYKVVAKADGYTDSAAASYTYTPSVNPPQPQTLAMPTGLVVGGTTLTWVTVPNATSYTVSDGTKTVTANTNSIDLTANGLTVTGTVTYTVVAKASGYNDSPAASKTHTFEHTHTFDTTQWENNETHHWRDITCGHSILVEESLDYGVHDFGDGNTCTVCGYQREEQNTAQYVYYGEYPQSLMAANVTLGASTDSDGYYLGSDGERYAKVTATPYLMYTWSNVKFSNNEKVNEGTDYFFKVEPIKWRVLGKKDGSSLLFCDSIIDHGAYYSSHDNREIGDSTIAPSNYMHSDIRTWLNGTFYNKAFSSAQQQNIITTTVDNSAESTGRSENPYACDNTQDKVFLLSNREAINTAYGFIAERPDSDEARMLLVSDYARASGAYMSDSYAWFGRGQWWLRSPLWDDATCVDYPTPSGTIFSGDVDNTHVGIAPAMRVTTSAL